MRVDGSMKTTSRSGPRPELSPNSRTDTYGELPHSGIASSPAVSGPQGKWRETPLVKFEVAPLAPTSRNHACQFHVSPAITVTKPAA